MTAFRLYDAAEVRARVLAQLSTATITAHRLHELTDDGYGAVLHALDGLVRDGLAVPVAARPGASWSVAGWRRSAP